MSKAAEHALPSVEDLVSNALNGFVSRGNSYHSSSSNDGDVDKWMNLQISSRTDAGVHAIRNCFHVDIIRPEGKKPFKTSAVANGINSYLSKQTSKYMKHNHDHDSHGIYTIDTKRNSMRNQSHLRSVLITDVKTVQSTFNARSDAKSRIYEYHILVPTQAAQAVYDVNAIKRKSKLKLNDTETSIDNDHNNDDDDFVESYESLTRHRNIFHEERKWCLPHPLDTKAMQDACDILCNNSEETDYSSFRNSRCSSSSPFRKIIKFNVYSHSFPEHPTHSNTTDTNTNTNTENNNDNNNLLINQTNQITITVEATSFLLRMVRNMVGLIVQVGEGKIKLDDVKNILSVKNRHKIKIKPAPAEGLYLKNVVYD